MDILKTFGFGNTLAFLLPGFVTASGLSNVYSTLGRVFAIVTTQGKDSLGPLVFFILTSLTAGIAVSALRSITWDMLLKLGKGQSNVTEELDYSVLHTKDRIEAFNLAVENLYRYYQFSANMGLALIVLAVGRSRFWVGATTFSCSQLAILLIAGALLGASRQQSVDMDKTLKKILAGMKQSDSPRSSGQ